MIPVPCEDRKGQCHFLTMPLSGFATATLANSAVTCAIAFSGSRCQTLWPKLDGRRRSSAEPARTCRRRVGPRSRPPARSASSAWRNRRFSDQTRDPSPEAGIQARPNVPSRPRPPVGRWRAGPAPDCVGGERGIIADRRNLPIHSVASPCSTPWHPVAGSRPSRASLPDGSRGCPSKRRVRPE